jgi:hypothetical protein
MDQLERRKWARRDVGLSTTLTPVDGRGPSGSAMIRNISPGGACLSALREIEPGTTITLMLKKAVTARVIQASFETQGPPCRWTLNCAFVKEFVDLEELLPSYPWLGD